MATRAASTDFLTVWIMPPAHITKLSAHLSGQRGNSKREACLPAPRSRGMRNSRKSNRLLDEGGIPCFPFALAWRRPGGDKDTCCVRAAGPDAWTMHRHGTISISSCINFFLHAPLCAYKVHLSERHNLIVVTTGNTPSRCKPEGKTNKLR